MRSVAQVSVRVQVGRRPTAQLHYNNQRIGEIVILKPNNILVETQDGRRDRFRNIESCARFCGIPTSETIELIWSTNENHDRSGH